MPYGKKGKKVFFRSLDLAEAVNSNKNITVDVGQVMFNPTVTISSDILRQFSARKNANPKKWVISEVEDGGGALYLIITKKRTFVNALQWLIGLEIFLLVKDPSRVFLQQTIQMEHHLQVILNYLGFLWIMNLDYKKFKVLTKTH